MFGYNGRCNTFNNFSNNICVLNKVEDINLHVFSMTTRMNERKPKTKHFSSDFELKLGGRKNDLNQKWKRKLIRCECQNPIKRYVCEKNMFGITINVLVRMINIYRVL